VDDTDDYGSGQDLSGYSADWYDGYDAYGNAGDSWYSSWRDALDRGRAGAGVDGASGTSGTSASRPAYMFLAPSAGATGGASWGEFGGGSVSRTTPSTNSNATPQVEPLAIANRHVRLLVDLSHLCELQVEHANASRPPHRPAVVRFLLPSADATCVAERRPSSTIASIVIDWTGPERAWSQRATISLGEDDTVPTATLVVIRRDGERASGWAANLSPESQPFVAAGRTVNVAPGEVARLDADPEP
jgi:hypothetical protein